MAEKAILIDTDIFVDYLRNFTEAVTFFQLLIKRQRVFFSAITEAELLAGKINEDEEKREKLLHFLSLWTKVPVNNAIAVFAGDLSRKYDSEIPDALIAATAITHHATLLTRNIKDFKAVKNLIVRSPYQLFKGRK